MRRYLAHYDVIVVVMTSPNGNRAREIWSRCAEIMFSSLMGLSCLVRNKMMCVRAVMRSLVCYHDDVIKWKHSPRHWPFVRGIHRSQVNSQHKDQ